MVKLFFNPKLVPRTITRSEWYEYWRWVRKTRRELDDIVEKQMRYFWAYGTTFPKQAQQDFMDQVINPPVLLDPYMEKH